MLPTSSILALSSPSLLIVFFPYLSFSLWCTPCSYILLSILFAFLPLQVTVPTMKHPKPLTQPSLTSWSQFNLIQVGLISSHCYSSASTLVFFSLLCYFLSSITLWSLNRLENIRTASHTLHTTQHLSTQRSTVQYSAPPLSSTAHHDTVQHSSAQHIAIV